MFPKKIAAVISAAALMASAAAALPVSAQTSPAVKFNATALAKPKIIKASKNIDSVTLKWSGVKGATGYKIYKLVGKKYKTVATVRSRTTVKYKIKGLKSGKKYKFKVRAFKKSGGKVTWSSYSAAKTVTTKADYSRFDPFIENARQGIYPATPHMLPDEAHRDYYCLFDFDGDGIKELLLRIQAYHGTNYIIDYNHGSPECVAEIGEFSNGVGFGYIGRDMYTGVAHGGTIEMYRHIYKNKKIKTKTVYSGRDTDKDQSGLKEYQEKLKPFDLQEI